MNDASAIASQQPRPALCLTCDYDLTSLPDGACPECGSAFTHAHLREVALQRASKYNRWTRTLLVRGGTCVLAAMAFVVVTALCAMAGLYTIMLTAVAIGGASLLGAVIDQCLSFDRATPTVTRAKMELLVTGTISLYAIVAIGTVSAPFIACVMTTALCQLWRANARGRGPLIVAMPGACLLVLASWIVLSAQVRILRGFRFSDWNVRSASVKFRTEAMTAVEARRQGMIWGSVGVMTLWPSFAWRAWLRARDRRRASADIAAARGNGDQGSGAR